MYLILNTEMFNTRKTFPEILKKLLISQLIVFYLTYSLFLVNRMISASLQKKKKNQRVLKCFSDLEISFYDLWQHIIEIVQAVYTISSA